MKNEIKLFKALANETRLRILVLILKEELCVCHLEWALGMTQTKISRHLTVLKNTGLVNERRQGLWVFYSLNKPKNELEKDIYKNLEKYFAKKYDLIKKDLDNMRRCTKKSLNNLKTIKRL